jgi:perosamine synthetase
LQHAVLIPWWEPRMTGRELDLVKAVLESNYLNDGAVTREFELAISARLGVRHAIAVTSGTMAIFLALAGQGIGAGDEVIVPDLTFIATANAVTLAGARPVLVDIDPRRLTIDPAAFERAITQRTRAVIPVHVSGRAADMAAICEIASRHGVAVIEDAAEAFGSAVNGAPLGTIGSAGCFSFSPNKTITTGQGGAIVTNDDALATRLRSLKDQGRTEQGTGGDDAHPFLGYNLKLTNLQAAVGLAQLSDFDARLSRQREIYRLYADGLAELDGIRLPGFRLEIGETPLWTDALLEDRERILKGLESDGVGFRRFWLPLHTQQPYAANGAFSGANEAARKAVWLPSAFTLDDQAIRHVIARVTMHLANS